MRYPRSTWIPSLVLVAAFGTACGKTEAPACSPTDPACADETPEEETPVPLAVTQVSPAHGATDVDESTTVTVTFSRAVDPATVTSTSFTVGSVDGTRSVSGATATFTPASPLTGGADFSVHVDGVEDADGVGLESAFSSSFTTLSRAVLADAGADMDVTLGTGVTLDGSGSAGTGASFTWTQLTGPDVGALDGQAPSFTAPDEVGMLAFELNVSDGVATEVDTLRVWVLEDGSNALWVSANGSDANPGTRSAPLGTIQAAIDAADMVGQGGDVYISAGIYEESLTLQSRVSLYGGFDPVTWERDVDAHRPVVSGGAVAVRGVVANALTVEGLSIVAADGAGATASSIAVFLDDSESVTLRGNLITAGDGVAGIGGSVGSPGPKGSNGSAGTGATSFCVPGSPGGGGGGNYRAGGGGGNGGVGGGFNGGSGAGAHGGAGGGGGATYANGANGSSATVAGSAGTNGLEGAAFGTLSAAGYVPVAGAAGLSDGTAGYGGGGGGGGGGTLVSCGGGGGGGGGGGQRGAGGGAGTGGGASIGVLLLGTTIAEIVENTIATGAGGNGGPGGSGGAGGGGGSGAGGGPAGCEAPFGTPCTGKGGSGGAGSVGGRGGHGGGGGGGPSIGVVEDAAATATLVGNTFTLGASGAGGGSAGNDGDAGESVNHKTIS